MHKLHVKSIYTLKLDSPTQLCHPLHVQKFSHPSMWVSFEYEDIVKQVGAAWINSGRIGLWSNQYNFEIRNWKWHEWGNAWMLASSLILFPTPQLELLYMLKFQMITKNSVFLQSRLSQSILSYLNLRWL